MVAVLYPLLRLPPPYSLCVRSSSTCLYLTINQGTPTGSKKCMEVGVLSDTDCSLTIAVSPDRLSITRIQLSRLRYCGLFFGSSRICETQSLPPFSLKLQVGIASAFAVSRSLSHVVYGRASVQSVTSRRWSCSEERRLSGSRCDFSLCDCWYMLSFLQTLSVFEKLKFSGAHGFPDLLHAVALLNMDSGIVPKNCMYTVTFFWAYLLSSLRPLW